MQAAQTSAPTYSAYSVESCARVSRCTSAVGVPCDDLSDDPVRDAIEVSYVSNYVLGALVLAWLAPLKTQEFLAINEAEELILVCGQLLC